MTGLKPPADVLEARGPTESEHPSGCTYGGFSCGYWLVVEGCELQHWERHLVVEDDRCPCGTEYPGAGAKAEVYFDRTAPSDDFV